jgi:hypothetical protein
VDGGQWTDSWAVMIEKVGVQALWILLVVWVYFIAKYFLRFTVHPVLDAVLIIAGIASGIGVFLWLFRQSKSL